MKKQKKVVKNGKVAVLVSPGFGAGWYTWNTSYPQCLFDPDVVAAVLNSEGAEEVARLAEKKWGKRFYTDGADQLEVQWVPEDAEFQVNEYDGSESLEFKERQSWLKA